MKIGDLTYRRFSNATQYEIERFLIEWGYREYIGYSKEYLAELFRRKANERGREYFL